MPITRELTSEELNNLVKQGIDPNQYKGKEFTLYTDEEVAKQNAPAAQSPTDTQYSSLGAAGKTLEAHAGGIVGGGLGAVGTGALIAGTLGAPFTAGTSLIPSLLGLTGIAGGAMIGSHLGQKGQEAIEGQDTANRLNQEAALAQQQHPVVAAATDIGASALASGGFPTSPSTLINAGRQALGRNILSAADKELVGLGLKETMSEAGKEILAKQLAGKAALQNIAIQSAVNPAINTGLEYATTGQAPTIGGLLSQVAGGALMSGHNPLLNNRAMARPEDNTEYNPNKGNKGDLSSIPELNPDATKQSAFTMKTDDGKYAIDDKIVKKAYVDGIPKPPKPTSSADDKGYLAVSEYQRKIGIPVEQMRNALHENWLARQGEVGNEVKIPKPEEKPQPKLQLASDETPVLKVGSEEDAARRIEFEKDKSNEKLNVVPEVEHLPKSPLDDKLMQGPAEPSDVRDARLKVQEYEEVTKPLEEKAQAERQAKVDAESKRRSEDFKKAQTEMNPPLENGWTANQKRLINPKDILPSAVGRAEERPTIQPEMPKKDTSTVNDTHEDIADDFYDKNHYAPPSDRQSYDTLSARLKDMMAKGEHNSDEFHKTWKEMEDVKNKNKGMPSLDEPKSGTVGEHLERLKNHPTLGPIARAITLDPQSLKAPVEVHGKDFWEHYQPSKDTVHIGTNSRDDYILHEIIHAATTKKLDSMAGANHPLKVELLDALHEAQKHFGYDGVTGEAPHYGLTNLHEFIAEAMSNKEFQQKLNDIKTSKGTIWSRLVDAIRKLLGVDVKHGSMLERVLKPIDELMQMERPKSESKGENHYAPPKKDIEETRRGGPIGKVFQDTITRIRDINHPLAGKVADALTKVHNEKTEMIGRWLNPVLDKTKGLSAVQDSRLEAAMRYEIMNKKDGSFMLRTPEERKAFAAAKKSRSEMGDEHIALKEPVMDADGNKRLMKKNEYAWSTTPSNKVIETIREGKNTTAIDGYEKAFVDYNTKLGMDSDVAEAKFKAFKEAITTLGNKGDVGNQQFFNAARRIHSSVLPPEMTTKGFAANYEKYGHKMASDMSYFKHVESKPDVLSAMGETHDAWDKPIPKNPDGPVPANDAMRAALGEIHGESGEGKGYHNEKAISSIATTLFIGPGTQIHKLGSNLIAAVTTFADNPYQMTKMIGAMASNFSKGIEHASENGVLKPTARSMKNVLDSQLTMAERMQAVAKTVRDVYSLGDVTEKLNAGLLQAGIESTLPMKIAKANKGDMSQMQMMKRLDPDYVRGKEYDAEGISKLASRAIGYIHGTGDARTMPPFMLHDTEMSGFFRLSNWSIAQTNRFFADVYTPATNGNYAPLLNSLFGAAVGGYMIKELREKLQGKKGAIPSLSEIASSEKGLEGNKGLLFYNLMAAASYAGFGGMLTIMGKAPMDMLYKNKPQGMVFPLDEAIGDTMKTISDITTAAANDPHFNWLHATEYFVAHVATQNVQLGRTVFNQAINNGLLTGEMADRKKLSDKLGELRRFNMAEGLPYNEQGESSNPYMNLEQKSFKREQNPQKAMEKLPELLNNIVKTYGGTPDVMMQKIKALKQNTYATMPNPDELPLEFMKYVSYVQRKDGEQASQALIGDYLRHKAVNEAKASAVP